MPRPKGLPKTGGRRKGSTNKTPSKPSIINKVARENPTLRPLDIFRMIYRDESQPLAVRQSAARDAAPYEHARYAVIEAKVDTTVSASDVERAAAEAESKRIAIERFREAFSLDAPKAAPAEATSARPSADVQPAMTTPPRGIIESGHPREFVHDASSEPDNIERLPQRQRRPRPLGSCSQ